MPKNREVKKEKNVGEMGRKATHINQSCSQTKKQLKIKQTPKTNQNKQTNKKIINRNNKTDKSTKNPSSYKVPNKRQISK